MKRKIALALLSTLCLPVLHAAEARVWTSRKGSTIEAELVKQDGVNATLLPKDGKQIVLKLDDLSLADRQFLVENAGADEKILVTGELGEPEKQVRIDAATIKKLKDQFLDFGSESEASFELTESTHFLIASAGDVRPNAAAETAERVWHGMAFQHMNFRRDWGDGKMLIILAEKREAYTALGNWYQEFLRTKDAGDVAVRVAASWEKTGSTTINLDDTIMERFKLFPRALVFNVKDSSSYKKPMTPFLINTLSQSLLAKQMGGVSSYGDEGYFAVITGHSFYKEISLAGKSETNLLTSTGTDGEGLETKKGFEDGTSWARELKSMVRKGDIKPELEPMLKWTAENLKPEQLVMMYAFAYFMESTPARLNSFAAMVRRIETSKQVPAPIEIANLFGFDTVEAFNAEWLKFIKEGPFK
ncbi:hypothetical protein OKA04_20845 [Luteolibacter flavescens]|uniref:SLA1 homology domain-containing protein n=1 Tax=Luteolibacter flavescens TaxID=1859460 RepID=A0ABT3FUD5_9BACT|nr:hypothetical protein [Luteolibacter flavescens]MCW1887199.1 hypothetical protein [Luteolibacter flavescens]